MSWLIILFVVALAVSPVMWLKPSPRQRRLAKLRNRATQAGVKVELAEPPLHAAGKQMPSYRWRYPQNLPGPHFVLVREEVASSVLKPFRHGWRWRTEPLRGLPDDAMQRLDSLLARLPQDAMVLESQRSALVLWWYESQAAERFASYLSDFEALRSELEGHPDEPDISRHQQR